MAGVRSAHRSADWLTLSMPILLRQVRPDGAQLSDPGMPSSHAMVSGFERGEFVGAAGGNLCYYPPFFSERRSIEGCAHFMGECASTGPAATAVTNLTLTPPPPFFFCARALGSLYFTLEPTL